jgi:hypothetical protein
MGAWGIGLYSSDFALDLRGTIRAVARLPFAPETLLEHICAAEAQSATKPDDSDHTVFWLTVADQFAKRGIDCSAARDEALEIIDGGSDLAMMARLGMDEKSLVKRRAMLEQLRERIAAPIEAVQRRNVLKGPQKLLLDIGEVLTYPICQGNPINPYAVGKDWAWVKAWKQDGWGAAVIVDRGLAFDFLAWYRPMVLAEPLAVEPTLADLATPGPWIAGRLGTLTTRHAANMQLKSLGRVAIDPDRLGHFAPARSGVYSAVNDISICDGLDVGNARGRLSSVSTPRVHALGDIADDPSAATPRPPDHRSLSGGWRGEYRYQGDKRPPVAFTATIYDDEGHLSGEITETVVQAGGAAQTRTASIAGRRLGWLVKFAKRYETRSLEYQGEIDEAARTIAGHWSIPGSWSGRFNMTRDD